MSFASALALCEQDNRRAVMRDTWGHLAPVRNRTYKGRIVFAIGCFDSGELNPTPLVAELKGLDDSPWFYHALNEWLQGLVCEPEIEDKQWPGHARQGCVFEWVGTFRNYEFKGQIRLLFDASKKEVR